MVARTLSKDLPDPSEVVKTFRYENGLLFFRKKYNPAIDLSKPAGNVNFRGYCRIGFKGRQMYRHHLVWCYHKHRWPLDGLEIDHINGEAGDDRIENLRELLHLHNQWNTKKPSVCWDKSRSKWCAKIQVNRKEMYLGRFDTEEEAAKAYYEAKLKYHVIPNGQS